MNIPEQDVAPATFGAQIDTAKRYAEALRREAINAFFSALWRRVLRTANRITLALRHRAAPEPVHLHTQPHRRTTKA